MFVGKTRLTNKEVENKVAVRKVRKEKAAERAVKIQKTQEEVKAQEEARVQEEVGHPRSPHH